MLHLRYLRDLARKSLTAGISQKEERAVFQPLADLTDDELEAYEKHYPAPKPVPEPPAILPSNPTTVQEPLTVAEVTAAEAKRPHRAPAKAKKAAKTKG